MENNYDQFEKRKQDHIKLALMSDNQASECNPFDQFHLQHEALPDLNFDEITLQSTRFGKTIPTPFLVSSMTAGHDKAEQINRHLIEACSIQNWALGVGSQRRELTDKNAAFAWQPLKSDFPEVTVFSNIGIAQIITAPLYAIQNLVEKLDAKALIIHCNPLQESIQPEGTAHFKNCWQALENLVNQMDVPIIIKETGCGFSSKTLKRLNEIGIAAVDVSGLGGTHWGRIEGMRADSQSHLAQAAITFKNWGINTIQSIQNAFSIDHQFEVWGSGGVRHGLDAAKLLALGATTIGFAKPMLEPALHSTEKVIQCMQGIEYELKVAMFCTGSRDISELKESI